MAGKPGARHNVVHNPLRSHLSPPTDGMADPAQGAKVPRCLVCGMPSTEGSPVLPGLWAYVRRNVQVNLCERCVIREEEKQEARLRIQADPLTIWEEAG